MNQTELARKLYEAEMITLRQIDRIKHGQSVYFEGEERDVDEMREIYTEREALTKENNV